MFRKNVSGQYIFFCLASSINGGTVTGATVSVYVSKDNGSQASGGGSVTGLGSGQYRYDLTQGETNANQVGVMFTASNCIPVNLTFVTTAADPTDSVRFGLTALPNAAAAASGGLIINGSNSGTVTLAALTCTGAFTISDGIIVTASTTNRSAMSLTGNGSGAGLYATSGTDGDGIRLLGGTNGDGIDITGNGSGSGIVSTGGATANGLSLLGGSSGGYGLAAFGGGSVGIGIYAIGAGTGHGMSIVSGSGSTGNAINLLAASTNGNGFSATGTGFGAGMALRGGTTSGSGLHATGDGSGSGITATCLGSTGNGIKAEHNGSGSGSGLYVVGIGGTANGATFTKTGSGVDISGNITGNITSVTTVNTAVAVDINHGPAILNDIAQAGSSTTITLASGSPSTTDFYVGLTIKLTSGTGVSQARVITAYDGSTKVATVDRAWQVNPSSGTAYALLATDAPKTNSALEVSASTAGNPTLQTGTATAGSSNTITIQTALGADNLPNGCMIFISAGTGAYQSRIITGYVNSTKVVTVDRNWTTNPDSTSVYTIIYNHAPAVTTSQKITGVATTDVATTATNLTNAATNGDLTLTMKTSVGTAVWGATRSSYVGTGTFGQYAQLSRDGTAQAGAAGTITLDASANSNNNYYNNCLVEIIAGIGVGQSRFITAYNGTSKVATVDSNWTTNPDNTSVFVIRFFSSIPGAVAPTAAQVATAVWQDLTAGSDFSTANSIGALLKGFTFTVAGYVDANTLKVGGTTQTARDLGASVLLSPGTGTGQLDITSGVAKANATQILGTAISTPATAGILDVNVKNINNVVAATPGASGGILISGLNSGTTTLAALTITGATTHTGNVSMAAGLNITQSSSNTSALVITGNGTGHGAIITGGSGATGDGVRMVSAATNGSGLVLTATGTGKDLKTTNTSTDIVLAKTTNITGFNDIAATAVVSSGAITTSGGAVSTVTTVTNLTNAPTVGDFTATMKASITTAVWDAARTSYVVANSFGRALQASRDGTAQAGAGTTITLDASANANNDFYNNCLVEIIGGTGIGQSRFITDYVGSTKVATVNSSWVTNPDNTSVFIVKYFDQVPGASAPTAAQVATAVWQDTTASDFTTNGSVGQAVFNYNQYVRRGTAQAGASTTITLDASASSTDDVYNYELIEIISGTGVGQAKFITDYVGSTKVATVDSAWAITPDNTSVFLIKFFAQLPGASAPTAAQVATAVWQDTTSGDFTVSGSIGKSLFTSGNVPGASGGLFLAGTNAMLTVTGSTTLSDGLIINRSTSNASAIVATGNGTGSAISATAGATGDAVKLIGGSTSGRGLSVTTTDGHAIYVSALGATGVGIAVFSDATDGISVRGGTTGGNALTLLARGGNAAGLSAGGNGAGRGIAAQGGTTGIGFLVSGGSTSGDATVFQTTDGHAFRLDSFGTGMDFFLDNQTTNVILEKTDNITGFNDLAATDITSTGDPITLTAGLVESDVKAIDGSTSAATKQSAAARAVISGTITGATTTTTFVSSDLTSSASDNYVGRVVVLLSGTLAFQASTITDFDPGTDTITVEGFTSAPAASVTFIIV